MNYKEVFTLAQKKGYEEYYHWQHGAEEILQPNVEKFQYMELCLIQQWLRDKKDKRVLVNHSDSFGYYYTINNIKPAFEYYQTYEEPLLNGVHEALKLLA